MVLPEHAHGANPMGVSAAEWESRVEAAAVARALHLYGFSGDLAATTMRARRTSLQARALHLYGFGDDLAAQCVMVRLRGHPEEMLMVEWGVFFEEVTASFGLVRVGFDGTLIDSVTAERTPATASVVNMGCLPVAVPIFRERPEVNVILHTHPHAVMAVAATKAGLLPLSQAAFMFHGVAVAATKAGLLPLSQAAFMFHGVVTTYKYDFSYGGDFEGAMANGFKGFTRAMLLEHHGMYTVGRTAAEAFFVTFYINQACEVQAKVTIMGPELEIVAIFVKALAMANSLEDLVVPTNEHLEAQYQDMMLSEDYAYDGSREWGGIVRKLKREAANFNT
ncbi:class II aldolase/adducin N-terminal [Tribonema minus]|uniref:Class II aldolase/adducin N-terminal n=1 Tax=Tribonema minus TaxID=303371 RepID=A0A835YW94_9STRA|nr:class II aldolase/adducin N-terminal [Tribonema minus]